MVGSSYDRLAIGVDGGGTKTEAWLAVVRDGQEPRVIGRGRAGSSNVRAAGMAAAMANLQAAIDAAWSDAGRPPGPIDCLVLALSGAGDPVVREQVRTWVEAAGIAREIQFEHDAAAVLAAGTPDGWGVGLIVGTGSAVIAVDREGQRKVVGGWGYWFGDEGSAYWFGRQGLMAAARSADGRGPATALQQDLCEQLRVDDPRAMLRSLEQSGEVRSAIANLAPAVLATAAGGDDVARGLIAQASVELAAMVATAVRELKFGNEFPLALAGGVICNSEALQERLLAELAGSSLKPRPLGIVPHPAEGCLRLARVSV